MQKLLNLWAEEMSIPKIATCCMRKRWDHTGTLLRDFLKCMSLNYALGMKDGYNIETDLAWQICKLLKIPSASEETDAIFLGQSWRHWINRKIPIQSKSSVRPGYTGKMHTAWYVIKNSMCLKKITTVKDILSFISLKICVQWATGPIILATGMQSGISLLWVWICAVVAAMMSWSESNHLPFIVILTVERSQNSYVSRSGE